MRIKPAIRTLLAGCLLLGGSQGIALAAPTPADILAVRPKFANVNISNPSPEEINQCEVKLVPGTRPGSSGWLLLDSKKQPLRRLFSNTGKNVDTWSFFKDGQEVYREADTNANGRPDQFRWLGAAGTKWGVDRQERKDNFKIDGWLMISTDEVGEEVFEALKTRDFARLQALFINEQDMKTLKLPAATMAKLKTQQDQAQAHFSATISKLAGVERATFMQTERTAPSCIPADVAGTEQDIFKVLSPCILFETADKKHEWVQLGEMIQVGSAWRLTEAPSLDITPGEGGISTPPNPEMQKQLELLTKLEAPPQTNSVRNPAVAAYYLKRAAIIDRIIPLVDAKETENWIKQKFDSLNSAAQAGDQNALSALTQFKDYYLKTAPTSNLAAYGAYREMSVRYDLAISAPGAALDKLQDKLHEDLAKFVQTYPRAEDTPEALMQLAMGCEYTGKDAEAERYLKSLYTSFPDHPYAAKAKGSERRLGLVGKPLELQSPLLAGTGSYSIGQSKGKVVVVYYWAKFHPDAVRDFATLRQLQVTLGAKGVDIVCVNLDDQADVAKAFVQANAIPQAHHLFQASADGIGLNSPLATYYGITVPNWFVVGRDGIVVSRPMQASDLDDAIKKAL